MKARLALLVILAFVAAPSALAASPLEIKATVDHTSVGLGDPFRYVVEGRAPKAAALTVIADAGPFTVVAPPKTTRSRHGGDSVVRVEQTLVCLDRGCAPDRTARRVALPAARAFNSSSSVTSTAAAITLVPRVPESVVAAPRAIYHRQVGVPAASTTVPPILAAVVFGLVAVLLLAAAVLLVVRGPRAVGVAPVRGRVAGGLELALRLLRESAGRPAPDRRRAADYAARAAGEHAGDVVAEATRIAWSPPEPQPADVGALADRLESVAKVEQ